MYLNSSLFPGMKTSHPFYFTPYFFHPRGRKDTNLTSKTMTMVTIIACQPAAMAASCSLLWSWKRIPPKLSQVVVLQHSSLPLLNSFQLCFLHNGPETTQNHYISPFAKPRDYFSKYICSYLTLPSVGYINTGSCAILFHWPFSFKPLNCPFLPVQQPCATQLTCLSHQHLLSSLFIADYIFVLTTRPKFSFIISLKNQLLGSSVVCKSEKVIDDSHCILTSS